ncbi:MAG: hypothetical protein GXO15_01465 [Crenarchaeota archaeon]|nr:hypothetical protein [Thermoproteota archaeon]
MAVLLAVFVAGLALLVAALLYYAAGAPGEGEPQGEGGSGACGVRVNTHPLGFTLVVFFLSTLWFRVNNVPVFPLGALVGLLVAVWHRDIERAVLGEDHFAWMLAFTFIGALLGLLLSAV